MIGKQLTLAVVTVHQDPLFVNSNIQYMLLLTESQLKMQTKARFPPAVIYDTAQMFKLDLIRLHLEIPALLFIFEYFVIFRQHLSKAVFKNAGHHVVIDSQPRSTILSTNLQALNRLLLFSFIHSVAYIKVDLLSIVNNTAVSLQAVTAVFLCDCISDAG